jgi:hypothetical protein
MTSTPARAPCAQCGNAPPPEAPRLTCSNCQAASYCSRECQVVSWKAGHKAACARLPAALRGVALRRATTTPAAAAKPVGFFAPCARGDIPKWLRSLGAGTRRVALSDGLMAQLLAVVEQGGTAPFVLGRGAAGTWEVLAQTKSLDPPGFAFYAPAAASARRALRQAGAAEGLWLKGPDRRGNFLGLGADGPRRAPLGEWHRAWEGLVDGAASEAVGLAHVVGDLDPAAFQLFRERPAE